MTNLLDSIIEATQGAVVVSQQHNVGSIRIEEDAIQNALRGLTGGRGWDASEYGITAEVAAQMLKDADTPEARARVVNNLRTRAIERAGLDVSNGRVAAFFAGKPAWHGLGVVVSRAATSAEAIQFAGMAWEVKKLPHSYEFNGQTNEVPDSFSIVRADTGAHLGTVGSRYAPVQNVEGFNFLDGVLEQFGARYESAGSIHGGKRVWILAHMPEQRFTVNGGDVQETYVLFTNCHDGTGAAACLPTSVRVECANTLRLSMVNKGKGISIRHTGNVKTKMAAAKEALGLSVKAVDEYRDVAQQMAKTHCRPDVFIEGVLDQVLEVTAAEARKGFDPLAAALVATEDLEMARRKFQAGVEKRSNVLADILDRYESERCHPKGTVWGAFNAITEHADHSKPARQASDLAKRRSNRFESILTGDADALKQTAYAEAVNFMAS